MRIGVLSDTHGNHVLMFHVVSRMEEKYPIARWIHLGDYWEDKETLESSGRNVIGVPGLWCEAYHDPKIPRIRSDNFEGVIIAYAHDPQVFNDCIEGVSLYLAGHTHRPTITTIHGVPFMNPGHMKSTMDRGQEATFGMVAIGEMTVEIAIFGLDGEVRFSSNFIK